MHEKENQITLGRKRADDKVEVPIGKYISLLEDSRHLSALRAAGVDNWEGYSSAMESLENE